MKIKLIILFITQTLFFINSTFIEHQDGVDIIFNKDWKLLSADGLANKNLYFFVLADNGKSLLKTINTTSGEMRDVLKYAVQSAESVAIDWINGNLYWTDRVNRFIEIVDLNIGLDFPIPKVRRRMLFSNGMADIDSLVLDPWEQYMFWLQIGTHVVLERARLDGSDRRVIYKSFQFKSSRLTIDRHSKMLFWFGMERTIHRVDYQGKTGCYMRLTGVWKDWSPSFLTFIDGKLMFINEDKLWTTSFTCESGMPVLVKTSHASAPIGIVASSHQLIATNGRKSPCANKVCSAICLPTIETNYRCVCMTGIEIGINKSRCPSFPVKSIIIASPPRIYHLSLDDRQKHMQPLFEHAGIPFRLSYDPMWSSILYVDYNSSSINSMQLNEYSTPQKLTLDFPIFSQIPASFAVDYVSRNIYWMNHHSSEVWVALMTSSNRLKYAALLITIRYPQFRDSYNSKGITQQSLPPGELAVDSENRYLFVTVVGDGMNSIERYWLDGSHRFVVINSTNVVGTRGLTLDYKGHKLFFVDAATDEMISIDYNGKNKFVIAKRFSDIFGLAYIDGFIYWTDIESLSVNKIRSDGTLRSVVTSTHNLRAATMPIVAISHQELNYSVSPCRHKLNNCDQLCFPTRLNAQSHSCWCSNPAHVLLNLPRCSDASNMVVFYNSSTVVIQHLPAMDSMQVIPFNKNSPNVGAVSMQLDHIRNQIYWINNATNCVMKTTINSEVAIEWQILCMGSDNMTSIGLDIVRNNMYVSISSSVWSRILLVRLPFPNSDIAWKMVVTSSQVNHRLIGAIAVHSALKCIFWFESQKEERFSVSEIYQASLDGSNPMFIWGGIADINELVVNDHAANIYWKNSDNGKIYRYDIITKKTEIFQLSAEIMNKMSIRFADWMHVYPGLHSLYIFVHDSIFQVDMTDSNLLITPSHLKTTLPIGSHQGLKGFSFISRTTSSKKVALAKTDSNLGHVIMCPVTKNEEFFPCAQFCLPTDQGECGCGSIYSLNDDKSTCTDSNDYLMVMTNIGEVIGIKVSVNDKKDSELRLVEWVEVPEQNLNHEQKFTDAVYWLSRDIVLRLDNQGFLSAVDQMRPFSKIKLYKQLGVQEEDGDTKRYSSSYEKIYKYYIEKDEAFKNQYDSSRFSLAIDPISDTLLWSDWVNGVIAAERLNSGQDRIEYLGVILDFRHSSRRPLQIAIAPISSSLIWISADLALPGSNNTSIWRQFWIEMSDLDGNRRSVLVRDPGMPSCLTVDIHSGRVYWVNVLTNKLMFLHVHWDNYQLRAGHVSGQNMRVTVNTLLPTGVGSSTSAVVVLKKYLFWTDWFQQVVASTSLNSGLGKQFSDLGSSEKTQIYNLRYLKNKLKKVVRLMTRVGRNDFKISSLGTLLQNHPCSHAKNTIQRCSHFCLSTLPISLAEEYSFLMTAQQLAGKFRCSCPISMSVRPGHEQDVCIRSPFVKCEKHQILCRAGRVFSRRDGMIATSCVPVQNQCDKFEDCLDGSDEIGCHSCNSSYSYSCSGSGICLPLHKRCDGVADCESDEQCCGNQRFECLSGMDPTRCLTVADRCNGIRDCIDGSDEHKCQSIDGGHRAQDEHFAIGNLSNNHTVAIIAGTVAISACSIAIIYICLSRRHRHKTVHESCLFRANNVNIMFMPPSQRNSRPYRYNSPYQRPDSQDNLYHAKSCDIIDTTKNYDESDPTTQSLTSLSDCYRRIKNPQLSTCSALGRPLFSINDGILFHLSQIRRRVDQCVSTGSVEKMENPPPSVVTINSEEVDKPDIHNEENQVMVSRNSLLSSPCESELEEIYVHRYQLMHRQSALENYPSCLLQNLLSACNQTPLLHNSPTTVSRDLVVENIYRRRRRKLFRYRSRRNSSKANLSLSPRRTTRLDNSRHGSDLYRDSSSNLHISPPPPSPITVLSA